MIINEKVMEEVRIVHKYCDVCGTELRMGLVCIAATCKGCGKDLCNNCVGYEESAPYDTREVWCSKCWGIAEKYNFKIEKLEEEIDRLDEECMNKCKYVKK